MTVATTKDSTVIFTVVSRAMPSVAQSVNRVCIISSGEGTRYGGSLKPGTNACQPVISTMATIRG